GSSALWERLAKGLFSRTLALMGIEPVPADATLSPLHRDAGRLRLSLDPSSRGPSRPLATRDQDFRVLDHDRRFGAGFDRREMSALPSGHPSTRAGDEPPWTPVCGGRRGTVEARAGARALVGENAGTGRHKTRSAHLLSPAERIAGG